MDFLESINIVHIVLSFQSHNSESYIRSRPPGMAAMFGVWRVICKVVTGGLIGVWENNHSLHTDAQGIQKKIKQL